MIRRAKKDYYGFTEEDAMNDQGRENSTCKVFKYTETEKDDYLDVGRRKGYKPQCDSCYNKIHQQNLDT